MSEKSLPKRAEEAVDDVFDLFRRRPVLSTLLVLIAVGFVGWFAYDKFLGIPALKGTIEEKNKRIGEQSIEIQKLETQLTPFRTLLAARGFTGSEAQGLRQLAEQFSDLELQLERALKKINSFAGEIEVDFTGDWDKTPVNGGVMVIGETPVARIKIELSDGTIKDLEMHLTDPLPRVTEQAPGKALLKFRMNARTGAWILDSRLDQLTFCREFEFATYGIKRSLSKDGEILVPGFRIRLFANGRSIFSIGEQGNMKLAIGEPDATPTLQWKGKTKFEVSR